MSESFQNLPGLHVALQQSEWSDLASISQVRLPASRFVYMDSNWENTNRLFSQSANRKLEDSAQMAVVRISNSFAKNENQHPLSHKGDLLILPLKFVELIHSVSSKDHLNLKSLLEPFNIQVSDHCLDKEWEKWFVYEGIRRNTGVAQDLCTSLGLVCRWKKRAEDTTWEDLAELITRTNSSQNKSESLASVFCSNIQNLLSETRSWQNTEGFPVAVARSWIKIQSSSEAYAAKLKMKTKLDSLIIESKISRLENDQEYPNAIVTECKKIKNAHAKSFSKEFTPLSLAFLLRFIYLNEVSTIDPKSFRTRLQQIKESDGEKAARLAAFLVSARMGAEKVASTFFISEPLVEETAEFSTMTVESLPDTQVELAPDTPVELARDTTTGDALNTPDS